jgi:cytoskeletal protein RodZ
MEELSLGNLLKDKRASLAVSLEQVAKDTSIPLNFLEALEEEDFGVIPGEGYVKGFLRTYCEYLEVDADPIIEGYNDLYGNGAGPRFPFMFMKRSRTRASTDSMARLRWHLLPTTPEQRRENLTIWSIISVAIVVIWILYYCLVIGNTAT